MPKYRLGFSWDEYKKKIEAGEWQLHQFPRGFVVTEVRQFQEEKVCLVHLLGGERFDEWKSDADAKLESFGREHGCAALEAVCRLGLEEKLVPLGWKKWHVMMRKNL